MTAMFKPWDDEPMFQHVCHTGPDLDRRLTELEARVDELTDKLDKHRHGYRWELS